MANQQGNPRRFVIEPRLISGVRCTAEDWSGMASAAERRKIQNRINARVYRRRKADSLLRSTKTLASPTHPPPTESPESSTSVVPYIGSREYENPCREPIECSPAKIIEARSKNAAFLSRNLHRPSPELLLNLISYNVFRAFLSNIEMLGFSPSQFACSESKSPFNDGASGEHLPPNFKPTAIQRRVDHHPVFDACPDPRLRDGIILWQDAHDDDDFCLILTGGSDTHREIPQGLLVWGEPNLIESWEVTETFFRQWWFLLQGCDELLRSSNEWRAKRGEGPLKFEPGSQQSSTM